MKITSPRVRRSIHWPACLILATMVGTALNGLGALPWIQVAAAATVAGSAFVIEQQKRKTDQTLAEATARSAAREAEDDEKESRSRLIREFADWPPAPVAENSLRRVGMATWNASTGQPTLPTYVSRDAEPRLSEQLRRTGRALVIAESGSGGTRTAVEVANAVLPNFLALVPSGTNDVAAAIDEARRSGKLDRRSKVLIFLDDIDKITTDAVLPAIELLGQSVGSTRVVATIHSHDVARWSATSPRLAAFLGAGTFIPRALTHGEASRARRVHPKIDTSLGLGLAFSGTRLLLEYALSGFTTCPHEPSVVEKCRHSSSVISILVRWSQTGTTLPIRIVDVRRLLGATWPDSADLDHDHLNAITSWLTTPVVGARSIAHMQTTIDGQPALRLDAQLFPLLIDTQGPDAELTHLLAAMNSWLLGDLQDLGTIGFNAHVLGHTQAAQFALSLIPHDDAAARFVSDAVDHLQEGNVADVVSMAAIRVRAAARVHGDAHHCSVSARLGLAAAWSRLGGYTLSRDLLVSLVPMTLQMDTEASGDLYSRHIAQLKSVGASLEDPEGSVTAIAPLLDKLQPEGGTGGTTFVGTMDEWVLESMDDVALLTPAQIEERIYKQMSGMDPDEVQASLEGGMRLDIDIAILEYEWASSQWGAAAKRTTAMMALAGKLGLTGEDLTKHLERHAFSLFRDGQFTEAVSAQRRAVQVTDKEVGPAHLDAARVRLNLARLHSHSLEESAETFKLAETAVRIAERYGVDGIALVSEGAALAGTALFHLNRLDEAEEMLHRAVSARLLMPARDDDEMMALYAGLAEITAQRAGGFERALRLYKHAYVAWRSGSREERSGAELRRQIQLLGGKHAITDDLLQ